MDIDNTLIGHVTWERVRCGVHNVTIEAKNNIGSDTTSWTITISNSYEVKFIELVLTWYSVQHSRIAFTSNRNYVLFFVRKYTDRRCKV